MIDRAFEEPTLRFLFEGGEMDFKEEVREALADALPPPPLHFSAASAASTRAVRGAAATRLLIRSLLRRGLVSFAMERSTPARLLAFYEVTAMADPALASVLANHFVAAGLISSHGQVSLKRRCARWLNKADTGDALGAVGVRELVAEEAPPLNTEARYDYDEKCFVIRGTGKFAVVGALLADYLIVSATLTTQKQEHNGTHLFVVPLKEEEASSLGGIAAGLGTPRKDIIIESMEGEGEVVASTGTATVYFDHAKIPVDHLLGPYAIQTSTGKLVYRPHGAEEGVSTDEDVETFSSRLTRARQAASFALFGSRFSEEAERQGEGALGEVETASQALLYRTRLATTAIAMGLIKKQVRDAVEYSAKQKVVGPTGYRDYPYLGLQEVQTPLMALTVKASVYCLAWNRFLQQWCSLKATVAHMPSEASPSFRKNAEKKSDRPTASPSGLTRVERHTCTMQLAGLLYFMKETLQHDLESYRLRYTGVHASFHSTGASVASAVMQLRVEGRNALDHVREVSHLSVLHNIGTAHWGWRFSSVARRFPFLHRLIQNPLYSPRIADLGRHYLFFAHKHFGVKKRLQRSLQIERRRGGRDHAWHDRRTFRHRDVIHCGEAFMEMHLLDAVMSEMQQCSGDLRARKILRDVGWIFALSRQAERLDYLVCTGQLSRHKAVILLPHLDNIITVFAPQARHVVESLCGRCCVSGVAMSAAERDQHRRWARAAATTNSPCGSEKYWTIVGAATHPERGESLTTMDEEEGHHMGGHTREEQENIRENPEEWDMLHNLADKPTQK